MNVEGVFESLWTINRKELKVGYLRGCRNKETQQRPALEKLDVEAANAKGPFDGLMLRLTSGFIPETSGINSVVAAAP
jgi:hypothetical protein